MRLAIDVGGTFTDAVLYDEKQGVLWSLKVSSTPDRPAAGFLEAFQAVLNTAAADTQGLSLCVHGTTIVTNSLLEGRAARTGLLVTEGFRDILEIGRQSRPELYDLQADRLPPLVPRNMVSEIKERIGPDGRVIVRLDLQAAREQVQALAAAGIESLAVSLLFSFQNSQHEEKLLAMARKFLPERFIFLSSRVCPEFREFERTSTTVAAAAVAPGVVSYLGDLKKGLAEHGLKEDTLTLMHSGGGMLPPDEAVKKPHVLVESGPAAGILASARLAQTLGLDKVIAFDMGGTTAKAGLVLEGHPLYTTDYEIGGAAHHAGRTRAKGYPLRFPMIDVAECGAGAGSIAWIDPGGHLRVGPQSAGADPGPACYGIGGTRPTVTDAYLVLGFLTRRSFLGGEFRLKPERSQKAFAEFVCRPLGLGLEEAAQGVLTLTNANILRILRFVSVERGHDPREFTLVAYGGAGPLHAVFLAEEMGIRRVVIPVLPGLFSAVGLMSADISADFVRTVMLRSEPEDLERINTIFRELVDEAERWFVRTGALQKSRRLFASADMRYVHQNYELTIPLPASKLLRRDLTPLSEVFHRAHETAYGHNAPSEPVQVVNLRVKAVAEVVKPKPRLLEKATEPAESALLETRTLHAIPFSTRDQSSNAKTESAKRQPKAPLDCKVYSRSALKSGHTLYGPAIIQEKEATTFLGPRWQLRVDDWGSLLLTQNR